MNGDDAEAPVWNFKTHGRNKEPQILKSTDIIFFEGILAFHDEVSDLGEGAILT